MSGTASKVREKAREYAKQSADFSTGVAENIQAASVAVAKDVADFNVQWIEMVRANLNLSLDFCHQLIGVKSPGEFLELSGEHARKQFELFTHQAQNFSGFAQKLTTDAVPPMRDGAKRAHDKAAA